MQRHRQLDDAQAGAEMAAGHRDRVDQFGAQLAGNLLQLALVEAPEIRWLLDLVEKRRDIGVGVFTFMRNSREASLSSAHH